MRFDPFPPTRPDTRLDAAVLVALVLLCLGIGYLGSLATTPALDPWYRELAKPSFTPPALVFPIVWTVLYIAMAVAAWGVWRTRADPAPRRRALAAFAVQLALNAAWSWAFFGARSPGLGLVVIVALALALAVTVWLFSDVARWTGLLMLPYLAWVAFAAVLNAAIFAGNG